jgi:amino acid permease
VRHALSAHCPSLRWTGIGVLIFVAIASGYTALLQGRCSTPPNLRAGGPKVIETYADVGEAAYGPWGRFVVQIQVHATLIGARLLVHCYI